MSAAARSVGVSFQPISTADGDEVILEGGVRVIRKFGTSTGIPAHPSLVGGGGGGGADAGFCGFYTVGGFFDEHAQVDIVIGEDGFWTWMVQQGADAADQGFPPVTAGVACMRYSEFIGVSGPNAGFRPTGAPDLVDTPSTPTPGAVPTTQTIGNGDSCLMRSLGGNLTHTRPVSVVGNPNILGAFDNYAAAAPAAATVYAQASNTGAFPTQVSTRALCNLPWTGSGVSVGWKHDSDAGDFVYQNLQWVGSSAMPPSRYVPADEYFCWISGVRWYGIPSGTQPGAIRNTWTLTKEDYPGGEPDPLYRVVSDREDGASRIHVECVPKVQVP